MRQALGRDTFRKIALATAFGAASSSCSYASAAASRTMFKRGASLVPSLAFLFLSTNLVVELEIILCLLRGWQFTVAECTDGIVPGKFDRGRADAQRARLRARPCFDTGRGCHPVGQTEQAGVAGQVAQTVVIAASMLRKDVLIGFLGVFVPQTWWPTLFMHVSSPWLRIPVNALIGPLVAFVSFVCSIGNVPLAAVL
jgi:uncharacterized membrane protein YraQ (UPF0718 family)